MAKNTAHKTSKKRTAKLSNAVRKTAKDFKPNVIDFGGGVTMQARLRLGGMQYLEDKYDCPLQDVLSKIGSGRIAIVIDFLVAMLMGEYPDKPLAELEAIVNRIDISEIGSFTDKLSDVLSTETKDAAKKKPEAPPAS